MTNDYTQVQWLKKIPGTNSHDAVILLDDIVTDDLTRIEADIEVPNLLLNRNRWRPFGNSSVAIFRITGGDAITFSFGNKMDMFVALPEGRHNLVIDNGYLTCDGNNASHVSNWESFNFTGFAVFGYAYFRDNRLITQDDEVPGYKFYGIKIYKYTDSTRETKNLVADLVPALRNSDSMAGIYDEVSDKFYSSYEEKYIVTDITECVLTINALPADAEITISAENYTQVGNQISVLPGTEVSYTVQKSGYLSVSNTIVVNSSQTINVELQSISQSYTLTVNTTPNNATVEFTTNVLDYSIAGKSITIFETGRVFYEVRCPDYITKTGVVRLNENKNVYVTLEKEPTEEIVKTGKIANFDYRYDYSPVVLWQYSEANKLKGIVDNEQTFVNTAITRFQREFDRRIFNLDTCDSNGLDLWGRLLRVQRPIIAGEHATDRQYRLLLKVRFSVLTWNGSCYGLTSIIKKLFPDALFKVTDNLDMTAKIEFEGGIDPTQADILSLGYEDSLTGTFVYTFLPRPAGVAYDMSISGQWTRILGFEGMTTVPKTENSTTNMGGTYDCDPDDHTGETGIENDDGGTFYK